MDEIGYHILILQILKLNNLKCKKNKWNQVNYKDIYQILTSKIST